MRLTSRWSLIFLGWNPGEWSVDIGTGWFTGLAVYDYWTFGPIEIRRREL